VSIKKTSKPTNTCPHCQIRQYETLAVRKRHILNCPAQDNNMQVFNKDDYQPGLRLGDRSPVTSILSKHGYVSISHDVLYLHKEYMGIIQLCEYILLASDSFYRQLLCELIVDIICVIERGGELKKKQCSSMLEALFCIYSLKPLTHEFQRQVKTVDSFKKQDINGCEGLNSSIDEIFKKIYGFKFTNLAATYHT